MKYVFHAGIAIIVLLFAFAVAAQVNPFDVSFPIAELGSCGSIDECKIYCDDPANAEACFAWAESNGIETQRPKDSVQVPNEGGPGGCRSEQECRAYCDHLENQVECINFAEADGYMSSEEAARAREHIGKAGPGGCTSQAECETYCQNPDHAVECIQHAVDEGFISQEEADRMLQFVDAGPPGPRGPKGTHEPYEPEEPKIDEAKAMELIQTIGGPGGCSTFEECDQFCSTPENDQVCMSYAIDNGLMSQEELERIQRMESTVGPGGCVGLECKEYCEQPGNELECIEFAHREGFMDDNEYEETKKLMEATGGVGPGGCEGRACEAYCEDPANQDECFEFAREHDLMPPEEIEQIERLQQKMKGSGGPGGCRDERECKSYCMDPVHFDECAAFSVDMGMIKPDEARMMMKDFVEVEHYGPQGEFGNFGPPMIGPPEEFDPYKDTLGGPPPGFEEEFERRFEVFEHFKENFEKDVPYEKFGPPPGFEGEWEPPHGEDFGPPPGFEGEWEPPRGEGFGPQPGFEGFPTPEDFPGERGEFPGDGEFPPPEDFPGQGEFPPDEFGESFEGQTPPPGFEDEFQQQYKDEYEQRYNDEYKHFAPPPGEGVYEGKPSEGEYYPSSYPDSGGAFQEPPENYQDYGYPPPAGAEDSSAPYPPSDGNIEPYPGDFGGEPPEGGGSGYYEPPPDQGEITPPPEGLPPGEASILSAILNILLAPIRLITGN